MNYSLIHLPVSLYLCLPISHSYSLITVSGPEEVFPLCWQQQGDGERETGGEQAVGRLGKCVIFPPPPIDCQQWFNLLKKESVQAQSSLTTYPYQSYSSRRKLAVALLPHPPTAPFLLDFYPVVLASLRFPHFFPFYFTGLVYKSFWTEPQLFTGLKRKPLW